MATIALGYADGYFRTLINRTHVHLAGHKVSVIGRISMDLVTIDVTDVPEAESQPGAPVEILGPHLTTDDLADHARTNAYEVMTALGRRYARVYLDAGLDAGSMRAIGGVTIPVVTQLGRMTLALLATIGAVTSFAARAIRQGLQPPYYRQQILRQMLEIGYYSLPVVGLTAIFTGMVLALQSYTGFARFSAESAIPNVVVVSLTRELGPVLAGLMVAGRVGAAMAAEIGTMRVTEQIDALTTLSTNPFKYLVAPRLIAGIVTLPLLVLIADIIGVLGGYLVGVYKLDFNDATYLRNTVDFLQFQDVFSGLVKAAVFGFLITLMGCYHGYTSKGGAQGVGAATTNAVVSASILILTFNYFITEAFFAR